MDASFRNIAKRLSEELVSTKEKLSIAVAWFTNEALFDILLEMLKNGVSIELILINDHINNRANGLDLKKFIHFGGKLYLSEGQSLMHNKFALIDSEKVLTGSYNWTYNAEYRNNENIVILTDLSIIEKFENEFTLLKSNSIEQVGKTITPPKPSKDVNCQEYLKNDLVSKSVFAQGKGDIKKSIEAISQAIEIDQNDEALKRRFEELKKKKTPEYHYHVEDGQFSFDFKREKLLGKEGEIVKISESYDDGSENEIYILYVNEFYVECIGNVDRSFPKNDEEHLALKKAMIKAYNEFE